jgi:choline dehydrogenase-like flavoprotein
LIPDTQRTAALRNVNQQWKTVVPSIELDGDYDYIVVGAGSAVASSRTDYLDQSQDRVLVLEAGGNDNWIWFHIPVGYLFCYR